MKAAFLFGTVGSPTTTPKNPGGTRGAIKQISILGLGALEMAWVQSVRISEIRCKEIKQTATEMGIKLSVHAPYFINLNATPEEWPNSRKRLMDAAHYGFLAGATDIIFHPGSYFGQNPSEVIKRAITRLRECSLELKATDNSAILRPETMGKSALFGSFEDTLELSKAIEGIIPCIDFAHLHARTGDGSMNSKQEWTKTLIVYSDILGQESLKHLHIHLSGIEYTQKGERKHLPIRESDLCLEQLFEALNEMDCGGRILCESPILEEDAQFMQELWYKLQK